VTANEIADAAATWLVRLEGPTSPQLWDDFHRWLAADARHESEFIRQRTAWTRFDGLKALRPADGRIDPDLLAALRRPGWAASAERRRWLAAAGATVLAGAGAALFGWLQARHSDWSDYETGIGGRHEAALPDHSQVILNTNTRLRIRLAQARRESELLRGEALYSIARDRLRPFYVRAARALVCGSGTRFALRLREDRTVELLVAEGRVALGEAHEWHLSPATAAPLPAPHAEAGQQVTFAREAIVIKTLPLESVARRLSWTAGRISFDGETLAEAVREFNRYNIVQLRVTDPALARLRVGGIFEATDPESFVAALQKEFGVRGRVACPGEPQNVICLVGR